MKTKYEIEEEDILANKKSIKIEKINRFNTFNITPDIINTYYNLADTEVTYRPAENFYDYYTGEWNND